MLAEVGSVVAQQCRGGRRVALDRRPRGYGCAHDLVDASQRPHRRTRETEIGDLDLARASVPSLETLSTIAGQLVNFEEPALTAVAAKLTDPLQVLLRTVRADAAIGAPHTHDDLGRWRIALK
jgi:hypothetical protein